MPKSINEPRYPTVKGTMKANRKQIPVWTVGGMELASGVAYEAETFGLCFATADPKEAMSAFSKKTDNYFVGSPESLFLTIYRQ